MSGRSGVLSCVQDELGIEEEQKTDRSIAVCAGLGTRQLEAREIDTSRLPADAHSDERLGDQLAAAGQLHSQEGLVLDQETLDLHENTAMGMGATRIASRTNFCIGSL